MMSLEKLLAKQKEREERKKEKERIKEEKRKEKLRLKKIEHKKKLRHKQNKRAYAKIKAVRLKERKDKGDERAYFNILITKNRKRVKRVGASWWKTDAFKIYNEAIEQNRKEVLYPSKMITSNKFNVKLENEIPVKYEIIMIKNVKENEDTVTKMRNDSGKYVNNIIADLDGHVIVAKDEWYVEETFNVYGYHPRKDRKTYGFILNEMLIPNANTIHDTIQIFIYQNKVFFKYINDFDFIICKSRSEAERLYDKIEKDITNKKIKNVFFTGHIAKNMTKWLLDEMVKKTGWTKDACKRYT